MPLRPWVLKEATDKYSAFKSECSKYWKELPSPEYARSVIPIDFANGRKTSWDWLCQHFESDEFKIRSRENTSNRGHLPFLNRGGPHPIAYKYLEELQKEDPFPMLQSYKEKMVAGATEGATFDFHCWCVEEADRRVAAYMNLHPEAEIEEAQRAVGQNEGEIVAYVRSQKPEPRRGNDLQFCGRLGQPLLSQASAAETGLSSRPRSSDRRRSSESSSTGGPGSSVPYPTPYQLGLEKKIAKQDKMIRSQRGKIKKQGYILKKVLGLLTCGCQNTGTSRQEEIDNMVAELESSRTKRRPANEEPRPENEDEDEFSEEEDEDEDEDDDSGEEDEGPSFPYPDAFHGMTLQQPDAYMGRDDSLTDASMHAIFGPPPQRQQALFIRIPGEHPAGTQPGLESVDEPAMTSKGRKDKGKAKLVARRRSTRRSNAHRSDAEEEDSSPELE